MEVPSIPQWLQKKNVFITGATGFIGKILLEKLLRSCPDIGFIYILVRAKRGKTPEERHQEIINHEIFSFTGFKYDFSKIVLVSGDLAVSGLGFTEQDVKTLQENVHIVFHIAASIKFNDPLIDVIKTNVRITRDIVELAKGMKNLEVFAHVSTAFVNSNRTVLEEKLHPSDVDWRKMIKVAERADPQEVAAVTGVALGDYHNTYLYSKFLAEHVVWESQETLPIFIYRPMIVTAVRKEPEPGWSDNFSGGEVLWYGIGKGIIRVVPLDATIPTPSCPCDVTVNGLIAAAWKVACHSKHTGEPAEKIYNTSYRASDLNEACRLGEELIETHPLPDILWTHYFFPITNDTLFTIAHLLINVLPNIFFQHLIKIFVGKDVPLAKIIRKYYVTVGIFLKPAHKQYSIQNDNFEQIASSLSPQDLKDFYLDSYDESNQTLLDLLKLCVGRVIKLFGERDLPKEERMRHNRRMVIIDRVLWTVVLGFVAYYFPYHWITNLTNHIANYVSNIFLPY